MSEFHCNGILSHTCDEVCKPGNKAPEFILTASDLSLVALKDYAGQALLLNVYISVDTPVCIESCKTFDKLNAADLNVLCISMDLPFSLKRHEKEYPHLRFLSDFRTRAFGEAYGLTIIDGPLAGLLARSVFVIDPAHHIVYEELCLEATNLPNIERAVEALRDCQV